MVEDWLEVDEPLAVVVEPVAVPLVEEELVLDVDPVPLVVDMLEDDVPVPVVVASDVVEVAVIVLVWL